MPPYVRDTITYLIAPLLDRCSNQRDSLGLSFFMNTPKYTPPPYSTGVSNTGRNVIPHLLRNKEYDLEWLLWAVQQKYLQKNTIKAFQNRINEITNG